MLLPHSVVPLVVVVVVPVGLLVVGEVSLHVEAAEAVDVRQAVELVVVQQVVEAVEVVAVLEAAVRSFA